MEWMFVKLEKKLIGECHRISCLFSKELFWESIHKCVGFRNQNIFLKYGGILSVFSYLWGMFYIFYKISFKEYSCRLSRKHIFDSHCLWYHACESMERM